MAENSSETYFKQESLQSAVTIDKHGRLNALTQDLVSVHGYISPDIRNNRLRYTQPDSLLEDVDNRYL